MEEKQQLNLHYKKSGTGPELVILHGLFGCLDNWQSLTKLLEPDFTVYRLDLRNHGKSPHAAAHSYPLMAEDLLHFLDVHGLDRVQLMGHSMGGKVAMQFLNLAKERVRKTMILDIAPKAYPRGHDSLFKAMFDLPIYELQTRNQADHFLTERIPEFGVRQFILKNLDRDGEGRFVWKINLEALYRHYDQIRAEIAFPHPVFQELRFVKGARSGYIDEHDQKKIPLFLPNASFVEIADAGHWIHADRPFELVEQIRQFFLNENEMLS
ncbi:MAG TPA: alpha/beta fold hydrolase [Saprospiraceae bacterium]|nr:alpha/beta fold hydrolase [Saprospiraceae bacterium]